MEKPAGVLEALAIEFAQILKPLEDRFTAREIRLLFAELGLQFPIELEDQQDFIDALENSARQALQLPALIGALTEAIQSDDAAAILEQTQALVSTLKSLVNSFETIASELENLDDAFPEISADDIQEFATELPTRLLPYLITTYIDSKSPVITGFLEFWGIIQRTEEPGDPADPAKPPFTRISLHLDRITELLGSPSKLAKTLYQWGAPGFDGGELLQTLGRLFARLNVPVILDSTSTPNILDFIFAQLTAKTDVSPPGLSLAFTFGSSLPPATLRDGPWQLDLGIDFSIPGEGEIIFQPDGTVALLSSNGAVSGKAFLFAKGVSADPNQPFLLFGQSGGSRLQAQEVKAELETELTFDTDEGFGRGEVLFEAAIEGGELFISPAGGDGFLAKVLPSEGFKAGFDFAVGFSSEAGFHFRGSGGLEINIPVHVFLGPVELQSITLGAAFTEDTIPIGLGATARLEFGPLTAVIENVGLKADFSFPESGGNLGPLNLEIGFKPPNGVGLAIDGGGFMGGGFLRFEPQEERYSGILQLEFQDTIALTAIGLLTTRLPDGSKGFSLLIIISAEFTPIQLGFGFTLNGVGGLLGLNRTMKIEALRSGIKNNTLDHILFPTNPVANANRIISDLRQVFPSQEGRFVFGPMAKIGWGTPTLISIEMGLLIEVPSPVTVALPGVLKSILPDEDKKLLVLQINFLGVIEFEKQLLSFDASLYESRLLTLTLAGDMALRLSWGPNPNFLLTVGGFHPAYNPPPLDLPKLMRLTVSITPGDNPRIRLETYFAVTSNTVQFGAKLELYAASGKFNVYGFLAFDVLFQFNPFYFIAQISAGLALRAGSSTIAGVQLDFALSGTTPWNAKGSAKLKILFVTIKVSFNKTWGERRDTVLPDVAVLPLLREALQNKQNWEALLPGRRKMLVTVKDLSAIPDVLVHPFGALRISQKVVPLKVEIDKFGSAKPSDATRFEISQVFIDDLLQEIGDVKEQFAPAQFEEMSDSQKLSRKSFEEMNGGVRMKASDKIAASYVVTRDVEYEEIIIDRSGFRLLLGVFKAKILTFVSFLKGNTVAGSTLSFTKTAASPLSPSPLSVAQEGFSVVSTADLSLFDESITGISQAEAYGFVRSAIRENPQLENQLQVVPNYEVNRP